MSADLRKLLREARNYIVDVRETVDWHNQAIVKRIDAALAEKAPEPVISPPDVQNVPNNALAQRDRFVLVPKEPTDAMIQRAVKLEGELAALVEKRDTLRARVAELEERLMVMCVAQINGAEPDTDVRSVLDLIGEMSTYIDSNAWERGKRAGLFDRYTRTIDALYQLKLVSKHAASVPSPDPPAPAQINTPALRRRVSAWIRGTVSHPGPNGPDEYDEECVPGEDQPEGDRHRTRPPRRRWQHRALIRR